MNLLITGAWQGYSSCKVQLEEAGHNLAFLQWEKDPLPVEPEWIEGVICNGLFLHHSIEQFRNLRYIQLTSAGFDRVPMDYVQEHEIIINNARGVYSIPMAEYAIGGVLQFYKQYQTFQDSQKKHEWNKIRTVKELNESTVCILGCGNVGTECAKRFKSFGCIVKGIDLFPRKDSYYDEIYPLESIDLVLTDADVLVMTLPLTDETRNLMNRQRLLLLKKDTVIVNIARGGVMDYHAFIELKTGERSDLKAVLDVFESEPLESNSPLWDLEGVLVSPHNSFVGNHNQKRLNKVILDNLKK